MSIVVLDATHEQSVSPRGVKLFGHASLGCCR